MYPALDITPKLFDNKNLKAPTIKIPEQSSVSLLCTVELLNGVEQLDNVEYLIEWFADGISLNVKTERCHQNDIVPCPTPDKEVTSKLTGDQYTAGKWVRNGFASFVCLLVCGCYAGFVVAVVVFLLNEKKS